jgi:hypothetical protein
MPYHCSIGHISIIVLDGPPKGVGNVGGLWDNQHMLARQV